MSPSSVRTVSKIFLPDFCLTFHETSFGL